MNRIYTVAWSQAYKARIAVSKLVSSKGKQRITTALTLCASHTPCIGLGGLIATVLFIVTPQQVSAASDSVSDSDGSVQISGGRYGKGEASVSHTNNVAVGASQATGYIDTSVGASAKATGINTTAMGTLAAALGAEDSALGVSTQASRGDSTALGARSNASGLRTTAVGHSSNASADHSLADGCSASATHLNSVALRDSSTTSEAVGSASALIADKQYDFAGGNSGAVVSIGNGTFKRQLAHFAAGQISASSTDAVNGSQLHATHLALEGVTALASQIDASLRDLNAKLSSSSVGSVSQDAQTGDPSFAHASGGTTVSFASAQGDRTLNGVKGAALTAGSTEAVNGCQWFEVVDRVDGLNVQVETLEGGLTGIANGNGAKYLRANSTKADAVASGIDSVAAGANAQASGSSAAALGDSAVAGGSHAVALEAGAQAAADNSVALGAASVADRANSVSVGQDAAQQQVTHVAAGTVGTDAVNLGQMNTGLAEANAMTRQVYNTLHRDIKHLDDKLSAGVAGAMAALPQPYSPGASMTAAGMSGYRGQSALAVGMSHISNSGRWVSKFQGNTNPQGEVGFSVGLGYQW